LFSAAVQTLQHEDIGATHRFKRTSLVFAVLEFAFLMRGQGPVQPSRHCGAKRGAGMQGKQTKPLIRHQSAPICVGRSRPGGNSLSSAKSRPLLTRYIIEFIQITETAVRFELDQDKSRIQAPETLSGSFS